MKGREGGRKGRTEEGEGSGERMERKEREKGERMKRKGRKKGERKLFNKIKCTRWKEKIIK